MKWKFCLLVKSYSQPAKKLKKLIIWKFKFHTRFCAFSVRLSYRFINFIQNSFCYDLFVISTYLPKASKYVTYDLLTIHVWKKGWDPFRETAPYSGLVPSSTCNVASIDNLSLGFLNVKNLHIYFSYKFKLNISSINISIQCTGIDK